MQIVKLMSLELMYKFFLQPMGFSLKISYCVLSDIMSIHFIRYSKFQSVASITLHFPENFGGETTQIHYIGLKGEATQVISLP